MKAETRDAETELDHMHHARAAAAGVGAWRWPRANDLARRVDPAMAFDAGALP